MFPSRAAVRIAQVLVVAMALSQSGCASWREARAKESVLWQHTYARPASVVVGELQQLLEDERYPLRPYDEAQHALKTDWRCPGSASRESSGPPAQVGCEFLVATVSRSDASPDAASVVVSRWSWQQEPGHVAHAEESRAFDVEWALLERVEPQTARRLLTVACESASRKESVDLTPTSP
jgi:hypothetical protein